MREFLIQNECADVLFSTVYLRQPEPIYSLVPLDIPHANTKIANLKRGIEEYAAEYNACKCKPCRNGGTVALIDGECMCLCLPLYEGKACQSRRTDKSATAAIRGINTVGLHYGSVCVCVCLS